MSTIEVVRRMVAVNTPVNSLSCSSEHPSILAKPHTEDTFQTAQLTVRGIRAFSPDNEEKITFYKPLTLIVGHNGAGKTVRSSC